jgi:predicted nucleic acid-binding protein
MIHGLDTGFLVAVELQEHSDNPSATALLANAIRAGDVIGVAPQVLAEFIHVVTDARRFSNPLSIQIAVQTAEKWWTARDVVQVLPDDAAVRQFFDWMQRFGLGRKRILDTLLAANFARLGISSIMTTNPADFVVFGCFQCLVP